MSKATRCSALAWQHPWRNVRSGVAVQHLLFGRGDRVGETGVFMEAFCHYRMEGQPELRSVCWELLPGCYWQLSGTTWLSLGIMVPLRTPGAGTGLLQLTFSLSF